MGRKATSTDILVLLGLAVTTLALEGDNGYQAALLLTPDDVQDYVTYTGSYSATWSSLATFDFWAPGNQTDGMACDSA